MDAVDSDAGVGGVDCCCGDDGVDFLSSIAETSLRDMPWEEWPPVNVDRIFFPVNYDDNQTVDWKIVTETKRNPKYLSSPNQTSIESMWKKIT